MCLSENWLSFPSRNFFTFTRPTTMQYCSYIWGSSPPCSRYSRKDSVQKHPTYLGRLFHPLPPFLAHGRYVAAIPIFTDTSLEIVLWSYSLSCHQDLFLLAYLAPELKTTNALQCFSSFTFYNKISISLECSSIYQLLLFQIISMSLTTILTR